MSEDDGTSRFGLGEQVYGFMDESAVVADMKQDGSNARADNNTQQFYPSSGWDFPVNAQFDSFDVGSAAAASQGQAGSVTPSWQVPPAFEQQQAQAPPAASPPFDEFAPSHVSPGTAYVSGPGRPQLSHPQMRTVSGLSHEELRHIAMPPHLQYNSPRSASSPDSANSETKMGMGSSPELMGSMAAKKDSRKRKVTDELEEDDDVDDVDKPVKKTAHNMIEKRYRTNINDKIAALRDSVPSLRIMSKSARGEDTTEDREELHGLTPAHKLNKATVLSKATEYIRHLEKRNSRLMDENSAMKERIAAFEKLFMAGAMNGSISPMQHPPTPMQYPQESQQQQYTGSPMTTPPDASQHAAGLIPVPDDMKRILTAQGAVGQPYAVPQQPFRGGNAAVIRQQQIQQQQQQQMQQNGWVNASPYFGKLMVGSLAGLMILEAVRENEVSNEKAEGRGLFALPMHLLGHASSTLNLHVMGYHVHTSLKVLFFLGAFLWVFVPSLFAQGGEKLKKQEAASLKRAPSLASSIHVRRNAWLTAIQTVWVPRHNFFLEASALMLKTIKLSLRNAIGVHGYQMLTGLTEEWETARVKAWSIALDSQLAGGDADISTSRLVLTLLASGTLPDTPARLMLKALHIRLLLWDVGNRNWQLGAVNVIAAKLARKRWNEARQLNRLLVQLRRGSSAPHDNQLPAHLVALVEQECDEVLSAPVIQRAHNLAFNVDTAHNVKAHIDGMDMVVDDSAMGSPMDAVAAWWSTKTLHAILKATLHHDAHMDAMSQRIELAIKVAPIGSVAQIRAIVARAFLLKESRPHHIDVARHVLCTDKMASAFSNPGLVINPSPHIYDRDLAIGLNCAVAISRTTAAKPPTRAELRRRHGLVDMMTRPEYMSSMTLLGFTARMELMRHLLHCHVSRQEFHLTLAKMSSNLRFWMGKTWATKCGVTPQLRSKLVERCLAATKTLSGPENDTGYGSLSDAEESDDD
ncbi:hypothetical protein CDD81_499 [Ophiocordyceps australis]|uniref:BHLH domain-containing protein n=1 Tax=Ophiocordyceps australis TaxID=1399860 RepID=A0A2C5Y1M9_9HYPO|nr:hypothetical protein CDD81_499 [Ophiocordyceps australis]